MRVYDFYSFLQLHLGGSRRDLERVDYPISRHPEFRYKTEFQSHEPEVILSIICGYSGFVSINFLFAGLHYRCLLEFVFQLWQFDYLKSLEIEEKINKIQWCQTANGALFLLSTNDKTIKFWKVETAYCSFRKLMPIVSLFEQRHCFIHLNDMLRIKLSERDHCLCSKHVSRHYFEFCAVTFY